MERGKKSPTNKMLRQVVPYIILIGIVLAIFAIGFFIGRLAVPSANVDKPDTTTFTTSTTEQTDPTVETTTPVTTAPSEEKWIEFTATAYCPCEKCCGVWATKRPLDENGNPIVYGATGIVLRQGVSVAADTSTYPMGTQLEIEGMGIYTVQDRGGSIKGNRIDIYFDNHDEAVVFGVQTIRVRVVK